MADTTKKASVQIVNEEQENMAVTEVETTEEENKTLIRMRMISSRDLSVRLIMRKMIHSASKLPEMERCFSHLKSDRYPKRNTTSARRNTPST